MSADFSGFMPFTAPNGIAPLQILSPDYYNMMAGGAFQHSADAHATTCGGSFDGNEYNLYSPSQQMAFFAPGCFGFPTLTHSPTSLMGSNFPSPTFNTSVHVNVPMKKATYTHNPYASSEPTTPTAAPLSTNSSLSSMDAISLGGPSYAPIYENSQYSEAVTHPVVHSLNEQFQSLSGSLCCAACTHRGRHLLMSVLRLQHMDKIQQIFDELAPHFMVLCGDANGVHVLRTLIEYLSAEQTAALVNFIPAQMVPELASQSQHTRRVLQTLFERHSSSALDGIVSALTINVYTTATAQQGCITIMRVLEHATELQKQVLLESLAGHLAVLTTDPYGNYVVQSIIQHFSHETVSSVVEAAFYGQWTALSCNKFASNVMEKVCNVVRASTRRKIIEDLIMNNTNLQILMQDGYGNFVIQSLIETSQSTGEFQKMAERVRGLLHTSPYGHRIEAKLRNKRFGRTNPSVPIVANLPAQQCF